MAKINLINYIIEYEGGRLTDKKTLELFGELIKTGKAWSLQGHYGRTARALIDDCWIDEKGKVNIDKVKQNGLK